MPLKRILLALALLIIIFVCWFLGWFLYYRSTCEGCGGCGYEAFSDKVLVEKIVCEKDSMCTIYLKSLTEDYTYEIYPGEFNRVETDFNRKDIIDTSNRYTIYGIMIEHGTCEPYGIDSMFLDKK